MPIIRFIAGKLIRARAIPSGLVNCIESQSIVKFNPVATGTGSYRVSSLHHRHTCRYASSRFRQATASAQWQTDDPAYRRQAREFKPPKQSLLRQTMSEFAWRLRGGGR
jgi:hypothetical protein